MSRKRDKVSDDNQIQLPMEFDEVLRTAEIVSRDSIADKLIDDEYSPIGQTAGYMQRIIQAEQAWETTLSRARNALLSVDARQIYFDFIQDMARTIEAEPQISARLSNLLHQVTIRGLGMKPHDVQIFKPTRGATRWRITVDRQSVQRHLDSHIEGPNFLNILQPTAIPDSNRSLLIGGSDVSQHRSSVPVPSRFFKRNVPFVLNNAAGTIFSTQGRGVANYENLFNPKPDEELLRWMLIDPSYQDELEPEDYQRIIASAMDIGQYKFDLNYLLKSDKRPPDVIFRDGSLFPQDAYLDNYILDTRRGEFVREAIREMLACLIYARELGTTYCGVAKTTVLKVYSAVVDWYIAKYIDHNWEVGNYVLNDGQAMSMLLATPNLDMEDLQQAICTCFIRRSFTTRAALNEKIPADMSMNAYFDRHTPQDIDISPYRRLCDIAHFYMFFIGHSKSPQQQIPRYEFFHPNVAESPLVSAKRILTALQHCSLMTDHDHSFMSDEPITYLIPSVTQQAHNLSKDVGKHIDRATGQWIMAQYRKLITG